MLSRSPAALLESKIGAFVIIVCNIIVASISAVEAGRQNRVQKSRRGKQLDITVIMLSCIAAGLYFDSVNWTLVAVSLYVPSRREVLLGISNFTEPVGFGLVLLGKTLLALRMVETAKALKFERIQKEFMLDKRPLRVLAGVVTLPLVFVMVGVQWAKGIYTLRSLHAHHNEIVSLTPDRLEGSNHLCMFLLQVIVAVSFVSGFVFVRSRLAAAQALLESVMHSSSGSAIKAANSRLQRLGKCAAIVFCLLLVRAVQDLLSAISYLSSRTPGDNLQERLLADGWPIPTIVFFAFTFSAATSVFATTRSSSSASEQAQLQTDTETGDDNFKNSLEMAHRDTFLAPTVSTFSGGTGHSSPFGINMVDDDRFDASSSGGRPRQSTLTSWRTD